MYMKFQKVSSFTSHPIHHIYGIDEVGRGPWAGPIVSCALRSDREISFRGLKESKQLSPEKREYLYDKIKKKCQYGIGIVSSEEIDELGLISAVNLSFLRAIKELNNQHQYMPKVLLIDGRDKLKLPYPHTSIIKGDQRVKLIACASIIAKVVRDKIMTDMHEKYPEYGFHRHKGYGTAEHRNAIANAGPCDIHRKTYKPLLPYVNNLPD